MNNFLVWFQLNKEYESYTLYYGDKELVSSATQATDVNTLIATNNKLQYNLGTSMPDITKEFKLVVKFKLSGKEQTVYADKSTLYKNAAFAEAYTYTGELGAIYESNKTTFRVWSPISSEVQSAVSPLWSALEILGARSRPIQVAPKSAICGCSCLKREIAIDA